MKELKMDASLLANILAQLSYQRGYIKGLGDGMCKEFDSLDDILGDLHCDILRQFEEKDGPNSDA